jgi:dinuclear metal center YbgI/SA1388 family protein
MVATQAPSVLEEQEVLAEVTRKCPHSASYAPDVARNTSGHRDVITRVNPPTLGELIALLDRWYDPRWAESWDSVGLVYGEPDAPVLSVHVAVDPTLEVARDAAAAGAGLLLTHHPLWLGGTERIEGPKGAVFNALARAGCALHVAHTNADVAAPGVSDALAGALGLTGLRPLAPSPEPLDRWVVHVPRTHTAQLLDAMSAAGAGRLGDYERCAFISAGSGTFLPGPGAQPYLGSTGEIEVVEEDRLELVAAPRLRDRIAAAVRAAHPYEEPSLTVTETRTPSVRGIGRIGELPDTLTLQGFLELVAARLPATAWGIRATGDPAAPVRTVAVAGGSTIEYAGAAAAGGADVFVTSDAKHHRAQEAPLPIVDVAHWAGEWPWTAAVAARLREAVPGLDVTVSTRVTDPWTAALAPPVGDRVDRSL